MCGIAGVATADPYAPADPHLLRQMTDIIRYRGPDGEGFYCDQGIGLGMRRLSIIDLAGGEQPVRNEDGSVIAICNGEIYNYVELREELRARGHTFRSRSDVEVIVHLYEELGVECLHKLRGMFALALWDVKERRLLLARDRLGIKPLHYALDPHGSVWFGSEIKSILMANPVSRDIDPQSVDDLFTFGFVLSPRTLFRHIRRVPPGHYLLYQAGNHRLVQYWDIDYTQKDRRSTGEWAEAVAEKFAESVRLHLRSDVPVGAWLSAGLDSSAVVAQMAGELNHPFQTFSLSFADAAFDEITHQNILTDFPGYDVGNERIHCTSEHFELFRQAVWHAEDPIAAGIPILHLLLARASRARYKAVLTGEGSDENFAGYPWHKLEQYIAPLAALPGPFKRFLLAPLLSRWQPPAAKIVTDGRPLDLLKFADLLDGSNGQLVDEVCSEVRHAEREGHDAAHPVMQRLATAPWSRLDKLLYLEFKLRMPDLIIHSLDRMSMSQSLEVRVPFLDHEFVELCAKIPAGLKLRGRTEKFIFREAMKPLLPPEIAQRKKRGLRAPTAPWLKGELPAFAQDLLSESSLLEKGYFNPAAVSRMLAAYRRGEQQQYTRALMTVLSIQTWDDVLVRGCRPGMAPVW